MNGATNGSAATSNLQPTDAVTRGSTAAIQRQLGLTLLEVVIAVAVLSVGILAAAGLQATGLKASRAAQQIQALSSEARSEMDLWRVRLATEVRKEPASGTCMTGSEACKVAISPCQMVAGTLDCDRKKVAEPVAQAVVVSVNRDGRSLTLRSIVLRGGS